MKRAIGRFYDTLILTITIQIDKLNVNKPLNHFIIIILVNDIDFLFNMQSYIECTGKTYINERLLLLNTK